MKTFFSKNGFSGSVLLGTLLVLAGCSLAPRYEVPSTPTTATFKEAPQQPLSQEEAGTWKTAQPSEDVARGEWWKVFEDAKLNDLEQQALDANQNLKAAAARVK
ncbi:RND transporter, partial [Paraburkholderia dipogonis]